MPLTDWNDVDPDRPPDSLWEIQAIHDELLAAEGQIRDGFLVGFSGSGIDQHLPEDLEEALHGLNEIAEHFDEAAERVQGPERDEVELSLEDFRQAIEVRTKEVETLLTAITRGTKELRKLGIMAASDIDEGTPIH